MGALIGGLVLFLIGGIGGLVLLVFCILGPDPRGVEVRPLVTDRLCYHGRPGHHELFCVRGGDFSVNPPYARACHNAALRMLAELDGTSQLRRQHQ